ncbi:ABC transporter permease [Pseudovibrio sp. Tun.PSC04-5.I4]|uniref:ABC transporter permease n=1 Tax=Pseudovibrio sp. Tun.PSC04-5.I4 TaxID=1798213 RepID=UPI000B808FCE|nr:ABC transporter permease [Pseudovibrio sp. Tun.PSC04-5.I4]
MNSIFKRREYLLAAIIMVMVLAISFRSPSFIYLKNVLGTLNDTSILMMLACAQMFVILTRCIDLSVGANIALTGMVVASLNAAYPGLPIVALLVIALALGLFLGAINGFFVWKFDIPPIVVTLGTMAIYRGLVFVLAGGSWINSHQMSESFLAFPRTEVLGMQLLTWFGLAAVAGMYVLSRYTRLGRQFYAIGDNPSAAVYMGITVGKVKFKAFCLSGMVAGLCGYFWVSRYAVAYVDIAAGFELQTVAACVIGGISIAGAIGTVGGAVLGALFLGVVNNALPVINISPFWQMAISGTVIILAVVFNAQSERKQGRTILKNKGAEA